MKIAVYGGSFDPPHIAHMEVIKRILEDLDIDLLLVIPAYKNPFKKGFFVDGKVRLKWMKKLTKRMKNVKVLDFEVKKSKSTPTITSVKFIRNRYRPKKIYLIIGADNLENLNKWKNYKTLKKYVTFVIASRDGIKIPKGLKKLTICASISSTKLRENLDKNFIPSPILKEVMEYYG